MMRPSANHGARLVAWFRRHLFWILGFLLLAGGLGLGGFIVGANEMLWGTLAVLGGGTILTGLGCLASRAFRTFVVDSLQAMGEGEASEASRRRLMRLARACWNWDPTGSARFRRIMARSQASRALDDADRAAYHAQLAAYHAQSAVYDARAAARDAERAGYDARAAARDADWEAYRDRMAERDARMAELADQMAGYEAQGTIARAPHAEENEATQLARQERQARWAAAHPVDAQCIRLLKDALSEFEAGEPDEKQGAPFRKDLSAFIQWVEWRYGILGIAGPGGFEQVFKLRIYVLILNLMLKADRETVRQAQSAKLPTGRQVHQTIQTAHAFFARFLKGAELENLKVLLTDPISKEFLIDPVILSSGQTVNGSTAQRLYNLGITTCPMSKRELVKDGHRPDMARKTLYSLLARWGCFELVREAVSQSVDTWPDSDDSIRLMGEVKSSSVSREPSNAQPSVHSRDFQPTYANAVLRNRGTQHREEGPPRSRSAPSN